MTLLLQLNGYSTSAVSSAEAALEVCLNGPWPDIALVDLDLPGMNGLELISTFQRLGARVYSVLLTAADADRVGRTARGRAVLYLQKPVDFPALLHVLQSQHFDQVTVIPAP
jgi:CheY-like chemotaxis protein